MVKNLILSGTSGFNCSYLTELLEFTQNLEDHAIVLMENGVLGAQISSGENQNTSPFQRLFEKEVKLYCLLEDFNARSYKTIDLDTRIQGITYKELIDLIDSSNRIISWL